MGSKWAFPLSGGSGRNSAYDVNKSESSRPPRIARHLGTTVSTIEIVGVMMMTMIDEVRSLPTFGQLGQIVTRH
jgi:hypothetical protein